MFGALQNKAAAWAPAAVQHLNNTFLMDSDNLIAKALPLLMDLLSFILQFTGFFFSNVSPPLLGRGPAPAVIPRAHALVHAQTEEAFWSVH